MADESVEVLVVGAGQAGVAMSEHLTDGGVQHLVLERDRIAEKLADRSLGLAGRERPGLARPVPEPRVH